MFSKMASVEVVVATVGVVRVKTPQHYSFRGCIRNFRKDIHGNGDHDWWGTL